MYAPKIYNQTSLINICLKSVKGYQKSASYVYQLIQKYNIKESYRNLHCSIIKVFLALFGEEDVTILKLSKIK